MWSGKLSSARLLNAFVALYVFSLCGCYSASSEETRKPNPFETSYVALAALTGEVKLCEKISSKAYLSAAWTAAGHQVHYVRSKCFLEVAKRYGPTSLCDKVKEYRHVWLDGSAYSPAACRKPRSGYVPTQIVELMPHILLLLGFDEATVARAKLDQMHYGTSLSQLQHHDPETASLFKTRLLLLPDFSRPSSPLIPDSLKYSPDCIARKSSWTCRYIRCLKRPVEAERDDCLEGVYLTERAASAQTGRR